MGGQPVEGGPGGSGHHVAHPGLPEGTHWAPWGCRTRGVLASTCSRWAGWCSQMQQGLRAPLGVF